MPVPPSHRRERALDRAPWLGAIATLVVAVVAAGGAPAIAVVVTACVAAAVAGLFGHTIGYALPSAALWTIDALIAAGVAAPGHRLTAASSVLGIGALAMIAGLGVRVLVARSRRRRRHEAAMARRTAVAAERARLARDMHDSLGKTLDALALGAAALPTTLD
jgi:signal transduction histidine kinase